VQVGRQYHVASVCLVYWATTGCVI
jgi:hypothetical protein